MINLIPTEEQKKIAKVFFMKLAVVFFVLLAFSAFVASVALVPAYFLALNKERIAKSRLEVQKSETIPQLDKDTVSLIKEIDGKMKTVENSIKNKFLVSQEVISQVVSSKMSDIKITKISFEEDINTGRKVSIYGTAPSRERLLLFRRALEENPNFSDVNLPVSNFIKGENIEFYLSLVLEKDK
jgi:hypothetical protein